jgi:Protein of unknown function (DUF1592)/Protein of unknown function (DUF1588)/Protein of unknown function (DUF1587)/Protein of unknown function (DUF1585)/Protein of unknown function (DUF1595)/Planctomycete cytochrome C
MSSANYRSPWVRTIAGCAVGLSLLALLAAGNDTAQRPSPGSRNQYAASIRPLFRKYCLDCHSTKVKKGRLDLERFATLADARKDVRAWQEVIDRLEAGEMPPKKKPQPTVEERRRLVLWARSFLDAEARARAGDPGHVPLRRLSNTEYDCSVRDLTGVDLRPAREFPADGAAGEGFTNAAEALSDISPTLLNKYLNAAREIAAHAVLLPDGFRFSPSKTRRDWTDEGTARLRQFYATHASGDGRLPVQPYLAATVRHRDTLNAGQLTLAEVAAREKLNAKYLGVLWKALTDRKPSQPLDAIRAKWRTAAEKDIGVLAADVAAWQARLWKTVRIGNYIQASWNAPNGYTESLTRQVPADPQAVKSVPLRVPVKPAPGLSEVVLYLATHEAGTAGPVVWHRPRFEGPGKPTLLLRDYADFGPTFEIDYPSLFRGSASYLAAAAEIANDPKVTIKDLAKRDGLDDVLLAQWVKVLAVPPRQKAEAHTRPAVALTLLDEKTPRNVQHPGISGWRKRGTDLPVVVANSSDRPEAIPGRVPPHGVAAHPMPQEFVAVVWKSPIAGNVRITVQVTHAHPACGNGVAWWLEHRRGGRATLLDEGAIDLGKEAKPPPKTVKVEKGDSMVLAVDARDRNHFCDMTAIAFTITEEGGPKRSWDLAADIASDVQAGNPHADRHGNADTWSFVRGPSQKSGSPTTPHVPGDSVLGRWRKAIADPERQAEADRLARETEALLSGPRPAKEKDPNRLLYDRLVAVAGPLFAGVDAARLARLAKPRAKGPGFGLPGGTFAGPERDSLIAAKGEVIQIRLPAALFAGRAFVVDARLEGSARNRLVRVRAVTSPPGQDTRWDGPLLTAPDGAGYRELLRGHDEFRKVFPLFICFPQVIPRDEVVTLKMFHREDEPLLRLFLDDEQTRQLDRLWVEQRFISRQPVMEYDYLPQFMGFTTQDTPKAFQQFFIDRKPRFRKDAETFLAEEEAAIPRQLDALLEFAGRAWRRPLQEKEKAELLALYRTIRSKGAGHDEAFRGVLARVLVSPAFLFRIEQAPPGKSPGSVNDWELATRLSYFLWSSPPDAELRNLAAEGGLRDPKVLSPQVQRMLKDDRTRALAIEFGTQWIHVRGFDDLKEKNEKLFPEFDAGLRKALYEEAILFFQDLFQNDRAVTEILDADYTFLNETLAKHYGIPGVTGAEWRRVEGVRKYGRGGILGLGSVQARQSGASRTSPVLRGNWVVETLLGEKLPRPPANVPQLPEKEGAGGLTMRQQVEKHARIPACAVCHVRIDPFGFALEKYDPIGRLRQKDLAGLPVDTKVKLRDGTAFEGIDGLRTYLMTKKKDVVVRLFCRRLLGYALGRAVSLSDHALIEEMVAELKKNGGRISAVVQMIVRSPQFRMIRGRDYPEF